MQCIDKYIPRVSTDFLIGIIDLLSSEVSLWQSFFNSGWWGNVKRDDFFLEPAGVVLWEGLPEALFLFDGLIGDFSGFFVTFVFLALAIFPLAAEISAKWKSLVKPIPHLGIQIRNSQHRNCRRSKDVRRRMKGDNTWFRTKRVFTIEISYEILRTK